MLQEHFLSLVRKMRGWRLMGKFKDWWERIKSKLKGEPVSSSSEKPKIVIKARHDSPTPPTPSSPNAPRITIGNINRRTPTASGTNGYRGEVEVSNPNIGRGITVSRRRKPGRCPNCATTGCIIENPGGRPKWKCTVPECGHTFD